jgi:G:T/U-mismatch repair DNA glycosylase
MLQQVDTAIAFIVLMLMLSLLVTSIVQAVSAVFDLRGRNLVRALADLFKQLDPSFRAKTKGGFKKWFAHPFTETTVATHLADAVATHPILAHTFTRAKAIRKNELLDVLEDLCSDNPNGRIDAGVRAKLKTMLASQLPLGAGSAEAARAVAAKVAAQFPETEKGVSKALADALGRASILEAGVQKWFDTVMDRASDIFTRWTRTITVATSILLVVVLQIDAGFLLQQISTNSEIRAGLTRMSDSALTRAQDLDKESHHSSEAVRTFVAEHKLAISSAALNGLSTVATCDQAKLWLDQQLPKGATSVQLTEEFAGECREAADKAAKQLESQVQTLRSELASTNLAFIPAGIFGSAEDRTISQKLKAWWNALSKPRHLLGTLAMVVLLSLGAPFWYNALKELSNLKPSITQKLEKESSGST